ncbi:MAG: hypothetical protein PW843_06470 [Azospirillaceae bacterium]|nr:hypothetical protein [Azospirillaceae bacterium]
MRRPVVVTLLALFLPVTAAMAQTAQIITKDFCDDQSGAFDIVWATGQKDTAPVSVFLLKDKLQPFVPVEKGKSLNDFSTFMVNSHGDCGQVGPLTAAEFAEKFKKEKKDAPGKVNFYSCNAAKAPPIGKSVVAALAAEYPGPPRADTDIKVLSGAKEAAALRPPTDGKPVSKISEAVYYSGVSSTGDKIVEGLKKDWNKEKYPGSLMTYKDYCVHHVIPSISNDSTFDKFVKQINSTFGDRYIELINTNSGGAALTVCGAQSNTACP